MAVLHQEGHPIAYFRRKLADRHLKLLAYEHELVRFFQAICHWRHYMWGRAFVIKTDHYSLKYLLQQRLTTSSQQHWMSKLLGFDFEVNYKLGKLNVDADALSWCDEKHGSFLAISRPRATLLEEIRDELIHSSEGQIWLAHAEADSSKSRKPSLVIGIIPSQVYFGRNFFIFVVHHYHYPLLITINPVVNRTIEMYLRCLVGEYPKRWVDTLRWAEYCYNIAFHSAL